MSRSADDLSQDIRPKYDSFTKELTDQKIPWILIFTHRTDAEQIAFYAKGRQSLDAVNAIMDAAGLPHISPAENVVVTNCDGVHHKSKHQTGDAFDLTFTDDRGRPIWPEDPVRWFGLGQIAERHGLTWGGRFQPKDKNGLGWDPDHFEV